MNKHFQSILLKATAAKAFYVEQVIQTLWSGYGEIVRYGLEGCDINSVIVKHVSMPDQDRHPRGWNSNLSHQRKIKSYHVEMAWYVHWSPLCQINCRVPKCFAVESLDNEMFILLEDLDSAGYPMRKSNVSNIEIRACLSWLAHFHAIFMQQQPEHIWPVGTYWHLDTRPDELNALQDLPLKNAAATIDQTLRNSPFQTFVHGDAKLANFCFSKAGNKVAAVDFQYVGGGCGMKDVAYFIGSCLNEEQCQQQETELLNYYFQTLNKALSDQHKNIDIAAVEKNWRALYPIAWTDFHRFIKGWSPGHWKINGYSERIANEVINSISQ